LKERKKKKTYKKEKEEDESRAKRVERHGGKCERNENISRKDAGGRRGNKS
jgi:hypothetical protein